MTPQSAKQKGRLLQQYVVKKFYEVWPKLQKGDVRSTAMGQSGTDVQLSPYALSTIGLAVECKSRERIHIYQWYWQAVDGAKEHGGEPVVVIKQNNAKPLVLVDLDYFLHTLKDSDAGLIYKYETEIKDE